uniref:Uncharacterized protein n=1 Tax=Arundo donax TaxID=35708 RepID=A0A0A9AC63_ARUDO
MPAETRGHSARMNQPTAGAHPSALTSGHQQVSNPVH